MKRKYIEWSTVEWDIVARDASKVKEQNPRMSWYNVVALSQDNLAAHRRRRFHSLLHLRNMFDRLGLDARGCAKSVTDSDLAPVATPSNVAPSTGMLKTASLAELMTELGLRFQRVESMMERAEITASVVARNASIVQKTTLSHIDVVNKALDFMSALSNENADMARCKADVVTNDSVNALHNRLEVMGACDNRNSSVVVRS